MANNSAQLMQNAFINLAYVTTVIHAQWIAVLLVNALLRRQRKLVVIVNRLISSVNFD